MKTPIFTGTQGKNHIQGIAVDKKKGHIYYSFTTKLIKATLDGEIVGSVDGLIGHLGCIAFNEDDGKVYGSLEYKNDAVGKGILTSLGVTGEIHNAFYIAIFDVDKITRLDMSSEADGIMTAVYLKEVVDDFNGQGINKQGEPVPHRYGCSGIDGTTFGPAFNDTLKGNYLYVTYGIYSDLNRDDNDHQVMLSYDVSDWDKYRKPLSQASLHCSGPSSVRAKYFIYTGNTNYGVQNLEYDKASDTFFMAVYRGYKPTFPNFDLFLLDGSASPVKTRLKGLNEEGLLIPLKPVGSYHKESGIYGYNVYIGTTGIYSFGDGSFLVSHPFNAKTGQCGYIFPYIFDESRGFVLNE